ncbi:MAG TPA: NAD(P)H-dependent oxidoreductase [Pseudonocardiaceae bacterium]|jgi:NAD(P)H-dependent FMN reductase
MSAESDSPLRVAIVTGSTRPGRKSETIARWVHDIAAKRDDATFEIVDIAEYALPLFDEPIPPMAGLYANPHTNKWAATVASFDAFVFVTPEYNRSTTGALKNALDYLYAEWNNKAAGFVSYGINGGVRATEHLRLILNELQVATVRASVALTMAEDFQGFTDFTPRESQEDSVGKTLDQVVAWGNAMRLVRAPAMSA